MWSGVCSGRFEVLGTHENPRELWNDFKRETVKRAEGAVGQHPLYISGVVLRETLDYREEPCWQGGLESGALSHNRRIPL